MCFCSPSSYCWKSAAAFSLDKEHARKFTVTRQEYEEHGHSMCHQKFRLESSLWWCWPLQQTSSQMTSGSWWVCVLLNLHGCLSILYFRVLAFMSLYLGTPSARENFSCDLGLCVVFSVFWRCVMPYIQMIILFTILDFLYSTKCYSKLKYERTCTHSSFSLFYWSFPVQAHLKVFYCFFMIRFL